MITKIFGIVTLGLMGLGLIGISTVGSVVLGVLTICWAIAWLANA